jgi:hypothetical protein
VKKNIIEKDLNQETNLTCARPTRWSSYLPTLNSMIILFSATLDVLEEIKKKKIKNITNSRGTWTSTSYAKV